MPQGRPVTEVIKNHIYALDRDQGLTLKQLGSRFGLRPRTVSNILRKWTHTED